jgi:protocatechuate 3,4-dioxygenase beta subunit
MRLVLPPEAKVTGLIVDKTGKGVSGAQIQVWGLTRATTDIDAFFRQPGDLNLLLSDISLGTKTDGAGRFTLRHLPSNSRILMTVEGPESFRKVLAVDTGEHKVANEVHLIGGGGRTLPLQGSPVKIERNQQKFLTFTVVDHTGQRIKQGSIQVHGTGARGLRETWLDERGEARIEIEHAGTFTASYRADPLHPRIGASRQIEVGSEMNAPTTELRLPESKWLSGRVVDADSGKGIVGAAVRYSHPKELQENDYSSSANCETDANGNFKLPVLPGKARIEVRGPVFGYFVQSQVSPEFTGFKERMTIDVPDSGTPAPVKLELARGLVVRGIVRDQAGKPVVGARIDGLNVEQPYRSTATRTNAEGRYELAGFNPRVGVLLKASSKSGAANFSVRSVPNAPLDQTLAREVDLRMGPGVTLWGRVTENGKPRPGVVMRLHHSIGSEKNRVWEADYVTDSDGVYRASGFEVGDSYRFEVIDSKGKSDRERPERGMRSRTVPAGSAVVQLADVQLASNGQSLRGVVVDPHGKPVPGVTVSASIGRGRRLTRPASGPPPWTETDKDGRFEIRQLPEEQIELMAYRRNPFGAHILYPAKIKPKSNDQNIRIIYDPNLNDDVEDLDKPKTNTSKPKNR